MLFIVDVQYRVIYTDGIRYILQGTSKADLNLANAASEQQ